MLREMELPASVPWLIAEAILLTIVAAATQTLKIYAAIALGHLAKKHRALWALLAYVGIGIVMNILLAIGTANGLIGRLLENMLNIGFFSVNGHFNVTAAGMSAGAMGSVILAEILIGTLYFFVTRYILKRHLNLE